MTQLSSPGRTPRKPNSRPLLLVQLAICVFALVPNIFGQDATVLAQAAAAFSGAQPVQTVQLTGSAEVHRGTTTENGTVVITANSNGQSSITLTLPSGIRSESYDVLSSARECNRSDSQGSHTIASSICWLSASWYLPHLVLQPTLRNPQIVVSSSGLRTIDSNNYQIITAYYQADTNIKGLKTEITGGSRVELALDPVTLLPAVLRYKQTPDDGSAAAIPIEVRFGNYQKFGGVAIPGHIDHLVNGNVDISLNITSATIN